MKQFVTNLVACLVRSDDPRRVAHPSERTRLRLEALETRWAPAALLDAPDIVVGASGPSGHVRAR